MCHTANDLRLNRPHQRLNRDANAWKDQMPDFVRQVALGHVTIKNSERLLVIFV